MASTAGSIDDPVARIPPSLVVDFDFMRPGPAGSDPLIATMRLQAGPPVVWTPHHGGHWIVTDGEIIPEVLADWERFSSRQVFIGLPPGRPRAVPLEYDPPEHGPLRKLLIPAFTPAAVKHWADDARELAITLIEELAPQGRCEFMSAFAKQLPMIILLRMLDLPQEHRSMLVDWVSTGLRSTDQVERAAVRAKINAYTEDLVDRRTAGVGDDVLSQAIRAIPESEPLARRDLAIGLASSLLGGGLDTVATTMGWIAWHLADNPAQSRELAAEPRRIASAIQEFLRRFSISNIARIVRCDMDFHGAPLQAGDAILMPTALRGLDARIFPDPLKVDFTRPNAHAHATLSAGPHRCIGVTLAHQELKIFLEEWLARIPAFGLAEDDPPIMAPGVVPGIERLTLTW
jgi:cytochrome P450